MLNSDFEYVVQSKKYVFFHTYIAIKHVNNWTKFIDIEISMVIKYQFWKKIV